ncbi:MarR family transcriptional regulator [Priestia megaterium]|nr:MarR family transcriptional regulator [Priestia megaterium]
MESLEEKFGFGTVKTSKRMSRLVATFLKPYNITPEQWTVLKHLSEVEQVTQKQLAEKADKDQATLTKILDLLEKRNCVKRLKNPDDRRSFFIKITSEGLALKEELNVHIEKLFASLIKGLDSEKLEVYSQILTQFELRAEKLQKSLEKEW